MHFDEKASGFKSKRDTSLLGLLKFPAIMISASEASSSTRFFPSNPNELCERFGLKLQGKQARYDSNIFFMKRILPQ